MPECNTLSQIRQTSKKKVKSQPLSPIMMGDCNTRLGKPNFKPIRILFDSGTTNTVVVHNVAKKLCINKSRTTKWSTKGGNFTTTGTCNLQ